MLDVILNLFIFLTTAILLVRISRKDGAWAPDQVRRTFRFFTCQSNVLCAVSALAMAAAQLAGNVPRWVWTLKYIGTAGVTVTMLTVFLFLAPCTGKDWYQKLLKGTPNLLMHFLNPLLAILSFCLLERQHMSFLTSLWGMFAIVVYGQHYLYRIRFAPEGKKWDDFYRFGAGGKLSFTLCLMLIGNFILCMLFMLAQNAP